MTEESPIRPMRLKEANAVSRMIIESIRADLHVWYPPEVVEGLVAGNAPEVVRRHGPKQKDYVYLDNDRIIGMVGVKNNEIGHLYVAPSHARRGIGRRLVEFAAELFRQAGCEDMIVLASMYAAPFYERCGFVQTSTGSFNVGDGHPLEYVRMRAPLFSSE